MELEMNFWNHVKALNFFLITTSVLLVIWAYLQFDLVFFYILAACQTLFTLPTFYLHIEYYLKNRGKRIQIEHSSLKIFDTNGNEKRYELSQLKKIIIYNTGNFHGNGWRFTPMTTYYYVRIKTNSGEEIVITCLMCSKLDLVVKEFNDIPQTERKTLFPSINYPLYFEHGLPLLSKE
jgi:hypothetical protein